MALAQLTQGQLADRHPNQSLHRHSQASQQAPDVSIAPLVEYHLDPALLPGAFTEHPARDDLQQFIAIADAATHGLDQGRLGDPVYAHPVGLADPMAGADRRRPFGIIAE